jgi:hypothetical protein
VVGVAAAGIAGAADCRQSRRAIMAKRFILPPRLTLEDT